LSLFSDRTRGTIMGTVVDFERKKG
jgi:hypothetical protein